MTVKEHYDRHLGNLYAWMLGDFNEITQEQKDFFLNKEDSFCKQSYVLHFSSGCIPGYEH